MKKLSSNSFKVSVAPESGADATVYWLVPSVTQVKRKADGTHIPEYVSCESLSKTGNGNPVAGIGTIKFILTYKNGSTSDEFIYASRIIITSPIAGIFFRLYVGGQLLDEKTILVVDDGQDGNDGQDGDDGHSPYISGHGTWMVWDATQGIYVDSGDPAIGDDGKSPKIEGGTWWVYEDGTWRDTGIKAEGDDGQDGAFMKQIFIQSDTCPEAPLGSSLPDGWSESSEFGKLSVLGYSGDFYLIPSGRRSPKSPVRNGMYIDKLRFTTSDPGQQIALKIYVSSESNYDFAYVGMIDSPVSEMSYHTRQSGISSFDVIQKAQETGEHYIEVMYKKDASISAGEDMMKYLVISSDTVWISSAQATYNKTSGTWIYGTWSRPSRYLSDTPDMEYIYRRLESSFVPESDPLTDHFVPVPFGSEEDYRGEFSLASPQVANAIYKSGENYYKCVKDRPANAVPEIPITDKNYFLYLIPFTDDPLGVTKEDTKEYMSFRKKANGKWGAFSALKLHANYAKGEDGLPGPAGERGRMPYPSGFWKEDIEYTATSDKTPIVYYEAGKTYYVMNKTTTVIGLNPVADYGQNGKDATWIPFENYKAIFTEILMATFAKLGSAVFHGDYMFSQQGVDANGNFTTDYGKFNADDPYAASNSFRPSICFNFKTGDIYAGAGTIKFAADGSGYVANGNFAWTKEGRIVGNIVPSNFVALLTTADLVNYNTHKLQIDDVVDTTIVFMSKNAPGAVIPDNARLKVALKLSSIYESDVSDGTILGKIHIINNSRILLTIEAQYSDGIHSVFTFPSRSDSSSINVALGFTSIKVKAGGSLEAYVIKNESGIGNVSISVLNHGDFEQINKALIINGVAMCGPGDIITKSFGSNTM